MHSKALIDNIKKALMSEPLFLDYFSDFNEIGAFQRTEVHDGDDIEVLEIRGQSTDSDLSKFKMLRLYVPNDTDVVISNIMMQGRMCKKGFGMKMIEIIYGLSAKHGYRLYIDDMVTSFYNKMLKNGAIPVDHESVEVIEGTELFSNRSAAIS